MAPNNGWSGNPTLGASVVRPPSGKAEHGAIALSGAGFPPNTKCVVGEGPAGFIPIAVGIVTTDGSANINPVTLEYACQSFGPNQSLTVGVFTESNNAPLGILLAQTTTGFLGCY